MAIGNSLRDVLVGVAMAGLIALGTCVQTTTTDVAALKSDVQHITHTVDRIEDKLDKMESPRGAR